MRPLIISLFFSFFLSDAYAQTWRSLGPDDVYPSDTTILSHPLGTFYTDSGHIFVFNIQPYADAHRQFNLRKWNGTEWKKLGTTGLTWSTGSPVSYYGQFAVNKTNDAVYCVTRDFAQGNKATVLTYNGTKWVTVGQPGFTLAAFDTISISVDRQGFPWVAYTSYYDGKLTVMKFNDTAWSVVGTPDISPGKVYFMSLAFNNSNTPFVAYWGFYNNAARTVVQKFNGAGWVSLPAILNGAVRPFYGNAMAFSPVDDSLFISVRSTSSSLIGTYRFDDTGWAQIGANEAANFGGELFTIGSNDTLYRQNNVNINGTTNAIQKFNGTSWVPSSLFTTNGGSIDFQRLATGPNGQFAVQESSWPVNYSGVYTTNGIVRKNIVSRGFTDSLASSLTTVIDSNNIVYATFRDEAQSGKASCMRYYGTTWQDVGTPGFTAGKIGLCVSAIDRNNTIYVAFCDSANLGKATVMKFNGSNWSVVGSAGFTSTAITGLALALDTAGVPYISYSDAAHHLSVKSFNGSGWINVGNSPVHTNYTTLQDIQFDKFNGVYILSDEKVIRLRKFNGAGWIIQGTIGNKTAQDQATSVKLTFDASNTPWILFGYVHQWYTGPLPLGSMYIKKRPAGSWLNCGPAMAEKTGDIVMDGDTAYILSTRNLTPGQNFYIYEACIKKFNGTSWVQMDTFRFSRQAMDLRLRIKNHKLIVSYVSDGAFVKVFNLRPGPPPLADKSACAGTNPVFVSPVENATAYQWQRSFFSPWINVVNGSIYSGANNDSLTIMNVPAGFNGYHFRCITTTFMGNDTSASVTLSVANPSYLSAKMAVSPNGICEGVPVTFSANINGGTGVDYSWKKNGQLWASNSSITLNPFCQTNSGGGQMDCAGILSNYDTLQLIATSTSACTFPDSMVYVVTVYPKVPGGISGLPCSGPITLNAAAMVASKLEWMLDSKVFKTSYSSWADTGFTVAAGNGAGTALNQLDEPQGIFVSLTGNANSINNINSVNIYVADKANHRVLRFTNGSNTGVVVAGGNGPGAAAFKLKSPAGVFVDNSGNVYVADALNHRIQKWAPGAASGVTVAGGNGPGTANNQLNNPVAVYVNKNGTIFISDQGNNRVQRWLRGASSGITLAGAANGVAGSAYNRLNKPGGIYVDSLSSVYVADILNHRVQKATAGPNSAITVAGGNGQGSGANQLSNPSGVFKIENGSDQLLISDLLNHRIQLWQEGTLSGSTVAGGNGPGSGNDQLNRPSGLTLDIYGDLFVSDQLNNRIRRYRAMNNSKLDTTGAAGTYRVISTSFNGCTSQHNPLIANAADVAATNTVRSFNQVDGAAITYITSNCRFIAGVSDAVAGNVPGITNVTLVRTNSTGAFHAKPYLRRHYDIIPSSDGPAVVTLYLPQVDFDSYNSYLTSHNLTYNKLPANITDFTGASHIAITHYLGTPASGTTGPGGNYDTNQKVVIIPANIIPPYDTFQAYWTVSFPVTDLSGGYYIHSNSFALKDGQIAVIPWVKNDEYFIAYPNPASGNITVETSLGAGRLQLMDLTGKVLAETIVDSKASFDLSAFSSGMYFIRYTNGQRTQIIKVTKE